MCWPPSRSLGGKRSPMRRLTSQLSIFAFGSTLLLTGASSSQTKPVLKTIPDPQLSVGYIQAWVFCDSRAENTRGAADVIVTFAPVEAVGLGTANASSGAVKLSAPYDKKKGTNLSSRITFPAGT